MKKTNVEKTVKFCSFCGHESKLEDKFCKSCKKPFIVEYNEFKYMAFEYITGDLEGKAFDKLQSIISFLLNKLLYGIVVLFSVVAAATSISSLFEGEKEVVSTTKYYPVQYLSNNLLENDEDFVKSLYKKATGLYYVNLTDEDNYHGIFKNEYVKISNISVKAKLSAAYGYYSSLDGHMMVGRALYDCSEISSYPKAYEYCVSEGVSEEKHKALTSYKVNKSMIAQYYEELFGKEDYQFESFIGESGIECEYSSSTDEIFCYYNRSYIGEDTGVGLSRYIGARTYEDRIEIDMARALCPHRNPSNLPGNCYTDDENHIWIASTCDRDGVTNCSNLYRYLDTNRGTIYTLTYLKESDGTYSWYDVRTDHEYYYYEAKK